MVDFEIHPIGTATRIEQLEAILTRANAAANASVIAADKAVKWGYDFADASVAAAYEVAARAMGTYHWNRYASKDEGETLSSPAVFTSHTHQHVEAAIRALATPDQTAALDRLIAEAEARVWADAAEIVRNLGKYELATSKAPMGPRTQAFYAAYDAILAASKKGGV